MSEALTQGLMRPGAVTAPPQVDFVANYNTPLSGREEAAFQAWVKAHPKAAADLENYDVRGAWKAKAIPASGHGPDMWKKPNHPTFSNESIYHGPASPGGEWQQLAPPSKANPAGKWRFVASPGNLRNQSPDQLRSYFEAVEKGNELVLPTGGLIP